MPGSTRWTGVRRVCRSFAFAFEGLRFIARTQPNFAIHLVAAALAVVASVVLGLTPAETAVVVLAITAVLAAEAFNTALEAACDAAHPTPHPLVKQAKDAAAAGVLVTAVGAVLVALALFGPRLARLVMR